MKPEDDVSIQAITRLHERMIHLSDQDALSWAKEQERYGSARTPQYRDRFAFTGKHGVVKVTEHVTKIYDANGSLLRSTEYPLTRRLFNAARDRHSREVSSVIDAILMDLGAKT